MLAPTQTVPFFICTAKTEWLDGKCVIFGKVKEGKNTVEAMESLEMEKPAISPLLTFLDKPRKFDLCSIFKKKKKEWDYEGVLKSIFG